MAEFIEILSPSALSDLSKGNAEIVKMIANIDKAGQSMAKITTPSGSDNGIKGLAIEYQNLEKATQKQQVNLEKTRLAEIRLAQAREKAFDNYSKQLSKEEAAEKATQNAASQAAPSAILDALLFKGGMGKTPAAKNFVEALKGGAKGAAAMGGRGAAAEAATIGIEAAEGDKPHDIIDRVTGKFGDWALMDAGFKALHILPSLPKYMQSAVKEFATQPEVKSFIAEQGLSPQIKGELDKWEEDRKSLEGVVPEDKIGAVTGLKQKIQNLKAKQSASPEALKSEIQPQIDAANAQISSILNSDKSPLEFEVDDISGEPLKSADRTHKTFDVLSKKEREGVVVPKDYGEATVTEVGEEGFKPSVTVMNKDGIFEKSDKVKLEDKVYSDKSKAQEAADEALRQHYYDNSIPDNLKPESKAQASSVPTSKVTEDAVSPMDAARELLEKTEVPKFLEGMKKDPEAMLKYIADQAFDRNDDGSMSNEKGARAGLLKRPAINPLISSSVTGIPASVTSFLSLLCTSSKVISAASLT